MSPSDLDTLAVRLLLPDAPAISRELPLRVVSSGLSGETPYAFVEFTGNDTLLDRIAGAIWNCYHSSTDWNEATPESKAPFMEYAKCVVRALS